MIILKGTRFGVLPRDVLPWIFIFILCLPMIFIAGCADAEPTATTLPADTPTLVDNREEADRDKVSVTRIPTDSSQHSPVTKTTESTTSNTPIPTHTADIDVAKSQTPVSDTDTSPNLPEVTPTATPFPSVTPTHLNRML